MDPTLLQQTWFWLLGAVWALYLVLGGTDLGVGMALHRTDRSAALRAIGPTWAANDVWLVIAIAATLGAFPGWYAAWTSTLYLPLIAILAALMLRHAGIELIGHASAAAARRWTLAIRGASVVTALGWGIAWAAALDGSLAAADPGELGVLRPGTVLAGLALVALCRLQGIAYLRLRIPAARGDLPLAPTAAAAAALTVAAAVVLAATAAPGVALGAVGWIALAGAAGALAAVVALAARGRSGPTLAAAAAATALLLVAVLAALDPTPIAGPGGVALADAAAGATTQRAMLVVAVVLLPPLLAALAFAYLRFLRAPDGAPARGPGAVVARALRGTLRELR